MPHYKDGTEAQLGDEVIGRGYNVKHLISGVVVGISHGADSCNLQVAHARQRDVLVYDHRGGGITKKGLCYPTIDIEYGQADHFERADLYEQRVAREQREATITAGLPFRVPVLQVDQAPATRIDVRSDTTGSVR